MKLASFFSNISTVTNKLTMGCNLKCTYCNTETVTPNTPKFSIELWKRVAELVITNSRSTYLSLEFHGGEPMLLDDDWYEEATAYVRDLGKKYRKIVITPMVTNGTMLNQKRLDHLRRLGVRFSMSCDGPPEVNDQARAAGHAVQRAIELFQKNEIRVGIMTVIGQHNYQKMTETMDWFLELGVPDFRTNFVQPQGRGQDESYLLSAEQMYESSLQILDHMVAHDAAVYDPQVGQHIQRFVEGREGTPQPSCWEYNCQAGKSYVMVDLHGQIHACGSDQFNHVLGSVWEEEIDEAHLQQKMAALHDKDDWYIRCFDCDAKRICNYSCATSDFNSDHYREQECLATKMLWNHFCEYPEKAHRIHQIVTQNGWNRPKAFVPVTDLAASPSALA